MSKLSLLTAAMVLSAGTSIWAAAEEDASRVPVLLELFTSEGCSSCPPADRLLQYLDTKQPVAGADLIVLSEHVDYWDRLGWRDPFSSPQYTGRQQEYASRFSRGGVYTPQLVVDGRFGFVGSDGPEAVSAIEKAIREPKISVTIGHVTRAGNQVAAHIELPASAQSPKRGKAVLYVAIADTKVESHVTRGENGGHTLPYKHVVREMVLLGEWQGEAATFPVSGGDSSLAEAALVQAHGAGPILAAAKR